MKKILLSVAAVAALVSLSACSSGERMVKSVVSNYGGGLYRTVNIYDYNGHKLESYTGSIDVQEKDNGNEVLFDLNGKRHVFYNAIVTIDEK